ncbi:MAG: endonuclease VIII [Pseudomonadota bacterium]
MPEGPEIRLAADRIAEVLEGEQIRAVELELPRLKPYEPELLGAHVIRVETRGKAMLTHFDNGLTLYSHNQLYGRWYVRARDAWPRTRRTLRVALHTERASALLYSASDIEILDHDGLARHPFLTRIGPDVLAPDLTWRALAKRLAERAFLRRSLASLYLDQSYVAGLGNYLRSEILFFAKVHPRRRPLDLSIGERGALARQTLAIAQRSYETRGITNPDRIVRRRKAAGLTRKSELRFAVFDRAGEPCDYCNTEIERTEAGSRRLYICPTCQL